MKRYVGMFLAAIKAETVQKPRRALIIVDVQNDFLPGGKLGVEEGDQVVPWIKMMLIDNFVYSTIVATQDAHPSNHVSFKDQGGEWPPHCVQGTAGEKLDPFVQKIAAAIFRKAETPDQDAYSGFKGWAKDPFYGNITLHAYLRNQRIDEVDVVGLALDYCVKHTAIDAVNKGYRARVLLNGTRPVAKDTGLTAILDMKKTGVEVV